MRTAKISWWCLGMTMGLPALAVPQGLAKPPDVAAPAKRIRVPLDEPLRLLADARQAYAGIQDYSCMMVKRERIDGKLQPDNVITMKARTEPFSVYFKWHEPNCL